MISNKIAAQLNKPVSDLPKRPVLLLDQAYQAVKSISWRKALDLVLWRQKAEPVLFYDGSDHIFDLSVVRLLYRTIPYSVRRRPIRFDRRQMYIRDGFACRYCGVRGVRLTVDHVLPQSRGGANSYENCVSACVRCNNKKADRTPEEAGMPLLLVPETPMSKMIVNKKGAPEQWRPFLE